MSTKDLAFLALRRRALIDAADAVVKEDRKALAEAIAVGERIGDPDVGYASMTNPADVVVVVDQEELDHFLTLEGKAVTHTRVTDEAEAIKVLREHAPHLLADDTGIPEYEHTAAKGRAKAGENIPGIALRKGNSSLRLTPSKAVKEWAQNVVTNGLAGELGAGE